MSNDYVSREPEGTTARRPLPGPYREQDVEDALAWYAAADAYDYERMEREAGKKVRAEVDDGYSDSVSSGARRRDRDQEAGLE